MLKLTFICLLKLFIYRTSYSFVADWILWPPVQFVNIYYLPHVTGCWLAPFLSWSTSNAQGWNTPLLEKIKAISSFTSVLGADRFVLYITPSLYKMCYHFIFNGNFLGSVEYTFNDNTMFLTRVSFQFREMANNPNPDLKAAIDEATAALVGEDPIRKIR